MRAIDLIFVGVIVLGIGLYAKAKDDARTPASVPKKNGVVCGQGLAVTAAEQQLNDKLGVGQGEITTLMTGKFGKIVNPKITGVTVNVVQPASGGQTNYILCAAIAGD